MAQAPPILIWQPGGGVPVGGIGAIEEAINGAGVTQLVEGQAYIDVIFNTIQTDDEWVFVQCVVVNTTDPDPLNIWPGLVTAKTAEGFRLQLNGMPDSDNYYLHWAISGTNIEPTPATTYTLSGPSSGDISVASSDFTVALPPSTTVEALVTVTLSDDLAGGTFTPASVTLSTESPSATFTYTPIAYGPIVIHASNDGGLTNPAELNFECEPATPATGYSLSGPSAGTVGVASTNFTVALTPGGSGVVGTVTVTPSSGGGGGSFTPSTVGLTTAAPSATFTYTPASVGAKTISVTDDGGLTDPGNLTYTASVPSLSDGDPVSTWYDSSVSGNNAIGTGGARPIFKTNIVNGKPVVRFTVAGSSRLDLSTPISGNWPLVVFAVMKATSAAQPLYSIAGSDAQLPIGHLANSGVTFYGADRNGLQFIGGQTLTAWHVLTLVAASSGLAKALYVDGTVGASTASASANTGNFITIGCSTTSFSDGDIAEILLYAAGVSGTDRDNITAYLGAKYGITVAGGGSVIDPSTVSGLVGWWKADSL